MKLGERVLDGLFEVVSLVQGSAGFPPVRLGSKGCCRFCGSTNSRAFRKRAHTFPEALGNKWIFSLDECDDCNAKFSVYESALADAVAPLLTIGGVKGKANRIRQTGRTGGNSVLTRKEGHGIPHISAMANATDFADAIALDPLGRRIRLKMPVAGVPFRPRYAYKALCKMALGILPPEELQHYGKLRDWLQDVDDDAEFPFLDVGLSFGSVGNAPPLAVGALLRRTEPEALLPYMLFLFSAGSVCLQIDLMSDRLEDHLGPIPMGGNNVRWSNVISDGDGHEVRIDYGPPAHLNWTELRIKPQPVEAIVLDFDLRTRMALFTPRLRPDAG